MVDFGITGGGTDSQATDRQTDTHINTMNRPGLGAGLSENQPNSLGLIFLKQCYASIHSLVYFEQGHFRSIPTRLVCVSIQ